MGPCTGGYPVDTEPTAVVGDADAQEIDGVMKLRPHSSGPCVSHGVCNRLLEDAQDLLFDVRGRFARVTRRDEFELDASTFNRMLTRCTQCVDEIAGVQGCRAQIPDRLTRLAN